MGGQKGWALKFAAMVVAAGISAGMPGPAAASETAQALLRDGIVAYRAGAPAQALQVFAAAATKAPGDALPALWAGSAAAALGQWNVAGDYFREALRRPHTSDVGRLAEAWLMRLEALNTRIPGSVDPQLGIAALAYASNPRLTRSQAAWLGQAVEAAAEREALDPWLLASVIYVESRFNHQSISSAGALGLGQLMPGTAQAAGVNPIDPWQNVLGAAEILRWNYLEFRTWPLALAGYNAGGDAVRRYGGIPPYPETQWYVRAVLWLQSQLRRAV
ncbi:MAG TPA: lytic transglycosylase domain-containing protein [bacterium]|nr:lytic transglycosylase domain-containing protein [bacterium]